MKKNGRYFALFIKSIVAFVLIMSIIFESRSSAYGEHASGGEGPVLAAGLAFISLGIYDIATAWSSAVHYNESIGMIQPLSYSKYRHLFVTNKHSFGMVTFSRNMLGNSIVQPISSQSEIRDKRSKSPRTALLWSAGATFIPMGLGPFIQNDGLLAAIIISSVTIGPSMGHFYAEQPKRGLSTVFARLGLLVIAGYFASCCT